MQKTLLLVLLLLSTSIFAKSEAILKLDTLGHTGLINDILVSKDRQEIISASDDKTIRVWDVKSGREKRKILGQIGAGGEGKIYVIALSSDNRYLAVGGFFNNPNDVIRIYNYHSGKLLKLLKSHTNAVYDLSFSSDDKYLVSGSADKSVKVWRVSDWSLQSTIKTHTNDVYAVKMIKENSTYSIYSAGLDNKIALHHFKNGKSKYINSFTADYKLQYLAINQKDVATCGFGKEILIFDKKLHLKQRVVSQTQPWGLAYSPDGKSLVAGAGAHPLNVNIYETKGYRKIATFKQHTNATMAVNFIDNKRVVSGGGNNNEIYIWDKTNTRVEKKIVGVGQSVWSVGIDGDRIAWGNTWTANRGKSKFQKSINLKTFQINSLLDKPRLQSQFKRVESSNGSYSLQHTKGGDYGYSDAVLQIKKDRVLQGEIVKDASSGLRHRCYGWYKDFIISGGSGGHLKIYNKEGKEVASLVGHTGEVWSIAVDGDRLMSGSDDQSMKVWDLSQLRDNSKKLAINKFHLKKSIKKRNLTKKEIFKIAKEDNNLYNYIYRFPKIYPILNLFISKDNNYVVWSKSGYFTSSAGGDRFVGYHINQGANKEARYVGSDKYFDTLYRPDIIKYTWETGSEKKGIRFASKTRKVQKVAVASSLPPVVYLNSSEYMKTTHQKATISFNIESQTKVQEIIVSVNGKRVNTRGLKRVKNKNQHSVTLTLEDGLNIVSIRAKNRYAMSDEVLVKIEKKGKVANIYKPTLYLLSIGVSQYKNSEYNLAQADKDAKSMVKMFLKQKGKIYKKVLTKTLINAEATKDNILDGLDWIDKETTSRDLAIIFIAGHGIKDDRGNYYFLGTDANIEKLRRTAVNWNEFKETIGGLPSKVILLADTCHSGDITGGRRDIVSAIKSITNSGSGSIIMTATTGSGYSYENKKWGHGAFTLSFLDGLGKAKADYNHDGEISIKEIDLYVTNRVKQLTDGKQKPTTIIPDSVPDFAIGVK